MEESTRDDLIVFSAIFIYIAALIIMIEPTLNEYNLSIFSISSLPLYTILGIICAVVLTGIPCIAIIIGILKLLCILISNEKKVRP